MFVIGACLTVIEWLTRRVRANVDSNGRMEESRLNPVRRPFLLRAMDIVHGLFLISLLIYGPVVCWTGSEYVTENNALNKSPIIWLIPSLVCIFFIGAVKSPGGGFGFL